MLSVVSQSHKTNSFMDRTGGREEYREILPIDAQITQVSQLSSVTEIQRPLQWDSGNLQARLDMILNNLMNKKELK